MYMPYGPYVGILQGNCFRAEHDTFEEPCLVLSQLKPAENPLPLPASPFTQTSSLFHSGSGWMHKPQAGRLALGNKLHTLGGKHVSFGPLHTAGPENNAVSC